MRTTMRTREEYRLPYSIAADAEAVYDLSYRLQVLLLG